jgi:hypothetical protein
MSDCIEHELVAAKRADVDKVLRKAGFKPRTKTQGGFYLIATVNPNNRRQDRMVLGTTLRGQRGAEHSAAMEAVLLEAGFSLSRLASYGSTGLHETRVLKEEAV